MQLEIEEAALKKEKDNLSKERLVQLQGELAQLREEFNNKKAQNIELVSINTNNNQQMIGIGDGLVIEDSILKSTGGQQQEINIDNVSITRNTSEEIQAVALKDGVIKVEDSLITKGNFNGVVELESRLQYNELKTNGTIVIDGQTITYDANTVYVIPSGNLEGRVAILEGTVTELSQDVAMALKVPVSTLPATELVGVDNTKSQVMIELGQGLTLQNNVLSANNSGTVLWSGKIVVSKSTEYQYIQTTEICQVGDVIEVEYADDDSEGSGHELKRYVLGSYYNLPIYQVTYLGAKWRENIVTITQLNTTNVGISPIIQRPTESSDATDRIVIFKISRVI
jgi:hypothetical protein